jgi:hypothetical protein
VTGAEFKLLCITAGNLCNNVLNGEPMIPLTKMLSTIASLVPQSEKARYRLLNGQLMCFTGDDVDPLAQPLPPPTPAPPPEGKVLPMHAVPPPPKEPQAEPAPEPPPPKAV